MYLIDASCCYNYSTANNDVSKYFPLQFLYLYLFIKRPK